jgi:hypothetical protein
VLVGRNTSTTCTTAAIETRLPFAVIEGAAHVEKTACKLPPAIATPQEKKNGINAAEECNARAEQAAKDGAKGGAKGGDHPARQVLIHTDVYI